MVEVVGLLVPLFYFQGLQDLQLVLAAALPVITMFPFQNVLLVLLNARLAKTDQTTAHLAFKDQSQQMEHAPFYVVKINSASKEFVLPAQFHAMVAQLHPQTAKLVPKDTCNQDQFAREVAKMPNSMTLIPKNVSIVPMAVLNVVPLTTVPPVKILLLPLEAESVQTAPIHVLPVMELEFAQVASVDSTISKTLVKQHAPSEHHLSMASADATPELPQMVNASPVADKDSLQSKELALLVTPTVHNALVQ